MLKKFLFVLTLMAVVFSCSFAFCQQAEKTKEEVIAFATEKLKSQGVDLTDVAVVYDEGGKLWLEHNGIASLENQTSNHGILVKGFLKNYRVVYFDFKEPMPDMWVFVDKDTGDAFVTFD